MQILDELASLIQKLNKRDNAGKENMATNNDQSQLFIAIAFRDQSLYIYLVSDSTRQFTVIDFMELKIPSLVIGQDQVLRTEELAETISDAVEVFSHEYNARRSLDDIPALILLEPCKFDIGCVNLSEKLTNYSEAKKQINDKAKYEVFAQSPFIQDDTAYEPFTISNNIDNITKLNIMYTSERFLRSWSNVVEAVGLKMAYIGSSSSPLLLNLAEANNQPCIMIDVQRLASRIYCINGKVDPIIELKFPYGYMQFMSEGNIYSFERMRARLQTTIKQSDIPSHFQGAKVYISGLPDSIEPTKLEAKNIEKISARTLKIDKKRIRFKKDIDEDIDTIGLDLILNIQSLCKRIGR